MGGWVDGWWTVDGWVTSGVGGGESGPGLRAPAGTGTQLSLLRLSGFFPRELSCRVPSDFLDFLAPMEKRAAG